MGILTLSKKNYQNPHPRAKNNGQKYGQNPHPGDTRHSQIDRIHPQRNKLATGTENKATGDSIRGFIKFLCRRSVGFYSRAFLIFLMKESKKRR